MKILGIETSCDETGASVVLGGTWVLSNVIASQIDLHETHGGVVPELAARAHVQAIVPVVERALAEAGCTRADLDAIAVTHGPGLAGSLLVGVNFAKAMAYGLDRPLVPVNHLEAHVAANWLRNPGERAAPPPLPAICLLVSGGHSELIHVEKPGHYRLLGRTLDDAAGEAFDKGARLLGLGYPGGPAIQRAAAEGDPGGFSLPVARLNRPYDFSFSGLKTALLREVEPYRLPGPPKVAPPPGGFAEHRPPVFRDDLPVADLAASYQGAIVEALVEKTIAAATAFEARSILLAGGVAANRALRERMAEAIARQFRGSGAPELHYPPITFCTDNAAMIAGAGYQALHRGEQAGWELDVDPRLPMRMIANDDTVSGENANP
ncbi:MAG: tRNA (adenosine(37)-N6)-threonylcarbamoyltransferase complex transferase subunit TsaD [Thermomicrobiales bacterium]|nr:tRNA (adenosine(37)-N6)-threonylcarbamoyltransferase complex transferase subunit TsaD [Thermomicrobiales bacterium]